MRLCTIDSLDFIPELEKDEAPKPEVAGAVAVEAAAVEAVVVAPPKPVEPAILLYMRVGRFMRTVGLVFEDCKRERSHAGERGAPVQQEEHDKVV